MYLAFSEIHFESYKIGKNSMITENINSIKYAISIRQLYVEQIMQRIKTEKYRSTKTNVGGCVYLYASLKNELYANWDSIKCKPGDLRR